MSAPPDSPPPAAASDTLSPPTGVKRAGSIMISPRHLPTAAPTASTGGGGVNMNALALAAPSADKLTKLEVFAPPEHEELKVFDKTLSSDVTQEEAIALLQKVDEQTALFREFSFSELAYLAQILTILKFAPGDTIIEAGEESSFVGMVLSGVLQVRFGDVAKPIPEGSLLGELSFFEGGVRTAAVSAQSEATVAMITWNEMEQLTEYAPTIRLKLMVLFALEGIKKMRQFNKPAATDDKAAAEQAANAPYNQRQKRASVTASTATGASAATTTEPTKALSPSASGTNLTTTSDVKSLKRGGSLLNGSLAITPGMLNDKAAAPQSQPHLQSRNVEALFRIRMKHEQKAQQEKIANALQKRKKAEHAAKTTTVIADAFKRELDKKQEFIEELYQENADLKEYKLWAQKKHIQDARSYREKVEQNAELSGKLSMESERVKAQTKANEELYASLETMVAARTKSYTEQISALQLDVRRGLTRVEASEKLRATLEENLKFAAHQKSVDDARVADELRAADEVRVAAQIVANEQIASAQRASHVAQDELTLLRFRLKEYEEKQHVLSAWKDEAIETSLQREMLHQRLHRNLILSVEKSSTIQKDLESYRTILKYLLVAVMVKNYRRKKALASILAEQVWIMEKLQQQVHESAARSSVATTARPKLLLPENLVQAAQKGRTQQKRVMQSAGLEIDEDGRMLIKGSDDEYDAALADYDGGRQDRQAHLRSKLNRTRADELFHRVTDLLPVMRSLVDEICAQKLYWNSTADSFFRRTIELKQINMDLEETTGVKSNTAGAIGTSSNAAEHEAALDAHLAGSNNNVRIGGGNFLYQPDSKESDSSSSSGGRHFQNATSSSASKHAARNSSGKEAGSDAEEDDDDSPATTVAAISAHSRKSVPLPKESMSELRECREKMVQYKRKCKDLRETNAMLSTRVRAFAERLQEMEEWQRNLYVQSSAAAAAAAAVGPVGFQQPYPGLGFMPPPPPAHQPHPLSMSTPLPPVVRAPPSAGPAGSASKTPRHMHQFSLGSYPPVSPAPPAASSSAAATAAANEPAHNPYFSANAGRPLATPTKDGPVFQIKSSVAPSPQQPPPPPSQPMHALYSAMTSSPSTASSSPPAKPVLNAAGAFVIRPSEQPLQPQPPSYLQPQMHAHNRVTSAPPLLVFPPSSPAHNQYANTARPANANYNARTQQAR